MSSLSLEEQKGLATLTEAIADTGYWGYWSAHEHSIFQVEFERVQLWNETLENPNEKLSSRIAVRFDNIRALEFLLFDDPTKDVPLEWPELMSKDQLKLVPSVSVFFNDREGIERELAKVKYRSQPFGDEYRVASNFSESRFQCLVIAGTVGFTIASERLSWLTNRLQEHSIEEVTPLHEKWWMYWRSYWDRRGTDRALPYNATCEITIPLK